MNELWISLSPLSPKLPPQTSHHHFVYRVIHIFTYEFGVLLRKFSATSRLIFVTSSFQKFISFRTFFSIWNLFCYRSVEGMLLESPFIPAFSASQRNDSVISLYPGALKWDLSCKFRNIWPQHQTFLVSPGCIEAPDANTSRPGWVGGSLILLWRLKKSSVTVDAVRNYGSQHEIESLRGYLALSPIPFHWPTINMKHNQEKLCPRISELIYYPAYSN